MYLHESCHYRNNSSLNTYVQSYRFCFHVLNSSQLHLTMPLSLSFALMSLIFFHLFEFCIILLAISYYTFHCCWVMQSLVKWKSLSHVWLFVILFVSSPSQKTGVGSHSLLQGIFPTQGSDPDFPHCRRILYCLSHQGSLSRSVVSDSLWSHRRQHTRLPCPSPSPRACSNACPLSQRCHPTICLPLILLPSIFPMIFSNDLALRIRWPKC